MAESPECKCDTQRLTVKLETKNEKMKRNKPGSTPFDCFSSDAGVFVAVVVVVRFAVAPG